jgi:hypothetical protein
MSYRKLFVMGLLLSASAFSAETQPRSQTERLNFFVPKGFRVAHEAKGGGQAIIEIIPEKQTVENWTRMITVQTFRHPESYHPERFIDGMGELAKKACENVALIPVRNDQQNGYPFSQKILLCTKNRATNMDETMNVKALTGK